MWEISWNTGYLLGNIYVGIGEIAGMGYHVNDVQMMQTDELQLMMSQGSHTKQSHKLITQINPSCHASWFVSHLDVRL